jgi:hypothetical protein
MSVHICHSIGGPCAWPSGGGEDKKRGQVDTYEDTSTARRRRALPAETLDFAIRVDLVVLENRHFDLLALVLDLLGSSVGLLLALLGTTT